MKSTLIVIAFSTAVLCSAAAPVASVSSDSSFALDGNSMTLSGVASWPMVVGDQVTSGASAAHFLFKDGSQLTLAPNSALRISGQDANPVVVLQSGALDYKIAKGSKLSLVKELEPAAMNPSGPAANGTAAAAHASHAALVSTAVSVGSGGVGTLLATTRVAGTSTAAATTSTADLTARKISISIYK